MALSEYSVRLVNLSAALRHGSTRLAVGIKTFGVDCLVGMALVSARWGCGV